MTDYTLADTIYQMFTTRAFATGVPTVLAGTPVVSAYENDSATQITAGITLGVSHDSVVGMNLLTIVATGANGYETGKDYNLVITTGTVGGVSVVGEVIGTFSLGRSAAAVDLANGTDGLGAIKTDTAAILVDTGTTIPATIADIPTVSEFNARTLVAADYFDPAADTVANVTLVATTTTNTDMVAAAPTAAVVSDAVWDELLSGHVISGSAGEALAAAGTAGDPWTTALPGAYGAGTAGKIIGDNINAPLATIDTNVDSILVDTGTTLPASIATIDTNVDAILVDTGTTIPAQIAALNDIAATDIVTAGAIATLSGAIVNVDLVDTTTTNTDMRGTDSAATATALATAQADLDIITGASGVNLLTATQASIDAILVDTGTTIPATIATVDTNVDSILVDTGTTLPAQITALNNIAAADVLAAGDIDGYTLEEAQKIALAALAGKLSGASTTTNTIRAADDSKARITATVDATGNRSAVTLDGAG